MQDRKDIIDFKILAKYLEGKGSLADASLVRRWVKDEKTERELREKSLQFWDTIPLESDTKNYTGASILDQIHHKIHLEEASLLNISKPRNRFLNYLTRFAAILFIPLLISTVYFYLQRNSDLKSESYSEIYAPFGTRTSFYLPDGSTGWLNGGSSLKFPTHFKGKTRDVKLSGEAYFHVISDRKNPFIVMTEHIEVKVTGTSFNVIAYPDEETTEVTLESGHVEVYKKSNDIINRIGSLERNESCIYNSKSDISRIIIINTTEKLAWLKGNLAFKYESFSDVIRKINRKYNVDIIIKDERLKSYTYYGTFKDETLEEVLNLLKLTAPIRYKELERSRKADGSFEKRTVEIYFKS
jgi:transmembrane sensor